MAMHSHPRRRFLHLHPFCQLVGQSESKNAYLVKYTDFFRYYCASLNENKREEYKQSVV